MHQKKIPYRLFWTWDHSTNWLPNTDGAQVCGVGNAYTKNPEYFEKDYRLAVDWCARHKMDAIGIVGMLRDRHGGLESARRLCAYARGKGVRIYLIAGLYGYGGIYYEGNDPHSLVQFLKRNPGCAAVQEDGVPVIKEFWGRGGHKRDPQACPSHPLVHEFLLESLDWVFKEIPELGGIQMESGDIGVCQCPQCRERRGENTTDEPLSLADMARIYPDAAAVIRRRSPDAWIICESYHHFLDKPCQMFNDPNPSPDLLKLLNMPEETFWQWKCDRMLRDHTWELGAPMLPAMQKFRHIMRAHSGTQWWGGRNTFAVDKIRQQCLLSFESGLQGVSMFGETSPSHVNAEFNYLALEYFSDHPHAGNDDFIADIMAPRLGGRQLAERYFEMAPLCLNPEKIPAAALEIARISAQLTDYDQLRRWQYLAGFLHSYHWEMIHGRELLAETSHNADRPDEF